MPFAIKIALLTSILLNVLFLVLGVIWIVKQGGLDYLISKLNQLKIFNFKVTAMYDSPFYRDKQTHFETLLKLEGNIIFLGDSLTDLCEWAEILQDYRISNRGICGDTTMGILNRLNNIIESNPEKLFIMIGINDLNQGVSVDEIANNYQLIIERLKNKIPETHIFIQSILPINNQLRNNDVNQKIIALNAKLNELAQAFSTQYINLFSAFLDKDNQLDIQYTSDGVHLNGQGYLVWKELIEKYVVG